MAFISKIVLFALPIFLVLESSSPSSTNRVQRRQTGAGVNRSECSSTYDVVIIGAGMAGLSAAVELYTKLGIKNIAILEARNRTGGRVYTIRHGNSDNNFEEYGAQWVEGHQGHEMMTFLSQNNLFLSDNEKPKGDDSWYNLNGEELPDDAVDSAGDAYDNARENIQEKSTVSIGDQLKTGFANWLRKNPSNRDAKQAVFNFYYIDECTDTGEDMSKVSTEEDSEYEEVSGDLESLVRGGYSKLLDRLTAGVPINSVTKFGAVVKKINYAVSCDSSKNSKQVAVYLDNGRVIAGKTAIVTLPLGVLKAGSVEFSPPLPSSKQTAISRLGYGCTNKLFLFFRRRWWGNNIQMNPMYLDSIDDGIKVQSNLYANQNESKWYRQMLGFNVAYGNNLMLQGWVVGDTAKLVERLPQQEVASVINQIFKRAFGKDYQVEEPYQISRTAWCSDPYAFGGYPYAAVGGRASDFEVMSKPVPERGSNVFFAGDSTSSDQWATVHGAWTTGKKAARGAAKAL